MILNVVIDIDSETTARGLADLVYYVGVTEDSVARLADISPAAIGTYQDEYRLTAEGWRIASRRMQAKFVREMG
jgi:predicted transcriptional regulator